MKVLDQKFEALNFEILMISLKANFSISYFLVRYPEGQMGITLLTNVQELYFVHRRVSFWQHGSHIIVHFKIMNVFHVHAKVPNLVFSSICDLIKQNESDVGNIDFAEKMKRMSFVYSCKNWNICDLIKQNELDVGNIDF